MRSVCLIMFRLYIILLLLLNYVQCETLPQNITEELLKYERFIKASHDLDKSDKALLQVWESRKEVTIVNVTASYRLEMIRHKENSFNTKGASPSWLECIHLHDKEIQKSEKLYNEGEAECLAVASAADRPERRAVHQVAKEIKKWRKSYRYLAHQCHLDNPGNEDAAGACLVEYMRRDRYDLAFQRLINLKHRSMTNVVVKFTNAFYNLHECLKSVLSGYLSVVRSVVDNLTVCYDLKNKSSYGQ